IGRRVSYKKKDVLKYEQSKTVLNTAQLATV
ncbi:DNA-binding protein, partial [Acinetobacter baumannii]|nr:DNA-binding protein [Acinetobacter baumannii]